MRISKKKIITEGREFETLHWQTHKKIIKRVEVRYAELLKTSF